VCDLLLVSMSCVDHPVDGARGVMFSGRRSVAYMCSLSSNSSLLLHSSVLPHIIFQKRMISENISGLLC